MKKTLLKERFQQLAGIKPLYEDDRDYASGGDRSGRETASQDLELKSLAKKLIPVIKNGITYDDFRGVKYDTSTNVFDVTDKKYNIYGKKRGSAYPGAKIVIENGVLYIGVYFLSFCTSDTYNKCMSGGGAYLPEVREQAGKLQKDILSAVDPNQFEMKSEPKPNEQGYYLMKFRLKNRTRE